jgi:hypothetical protein
MYDFLLSIHFGCFIIHCFFLLNLINVTYYTANITNCMSLYPILPVNSANCMNLLLENERVESCTNCFPLFTFTVLLILFRQRTMNTSRGLGPLFPTVMPTKWVCCVKVLFFAFCIHPYTHAYIDTHGLFICLKFHLCVFTLTVLLVLLICRCYCY